ncbi:hypothetical protein EUX98_g2334 [Antrodiella citrinella]|uniref:F-box domain-containing protein n=1 Tax=Antrodiella citrinella TaxID=2447956 RepID=A0A4S4MZB8_9APHY|nr:hypothetical protein EUX98_g2334 [Antrodiella citrinella]
MKLKIQSQSGGGFTPDVPQEIVDLIIDNLQDDPLALRACALTAHNWVHRSRRHLHSRVRIGEYYVNMKRYNSRSVAQYVKELDLYMVRTDRGRKRTTTDSLWRMIGRFPNLKSLIIRDFEFYRFSSPRRDLLSTICSRLRTLALHHVHFADPADFLTFIGSCEQLRNLRIEDGQFYNSHTRDLSAEHTKVHLTLLRKAGKRLPGKLTRVGLLKTLTLSKDQPADCAGTLKAVGSSLIDLRLARCNTRLTKPVTTGIEQCTNIVSLSFITSLIVPPRSEQTWIVPFLQQLPSPSSSPSCDPPPLRTLTFELHWSDKDCIDVDFLTEIDHILSSRQDTFSGLQEVIFVVHRHLSPKLKVFEPSCDTGPTSKFRRVLDWTLQFKFFLKMCFGTHLKGVVARQGCVVKLVFPNDGDVFVVEPRKFGEECKH